MFFAVSGFSLALNNNLISIQSGKGQKLLSTSSNAYDFWQLDRYFSPQMNLGDCGIDTAVMVLNAAGIKPNYKTIYHPLDIFSQRNIFNDPNVKKHFSLNHIAHHGLSLNQEAQILRSFPVHVLKLHGNKTNYVIFKKMVITALDNHQFVIVNFLRSAIGEQGGGHFSPIGAYDAKTDRFLVMDVSPYKYPFVWVKSKQLWKAVDSEDHGINKYRGFIIISKQKV